MYLKDHEKIKQIYHIFKQIYYDFLGKKYFQCLVFNMIYAKYLEFKTYVIFSAKVQKVALIHNG